MNSFLSTIGIMLLIIMNSLSGMPDTNIKMASNALHKSETLYSYVYDLDEDGLDELITMYRAQNDLCIRVNQSIFIMKAFYSGDREDFDISPKLKLMETRSNESLLYVYCSYPVNGGTDGYYRAKLLRYKDASIKEIWNTEMDREKVSYTVKNEAFITVFDDHMKEATFFYNHDDARYDKANRILNDSEETARLLKNVDSIKNYGSELLNDMDYNLDGQIEIITKNPIYFDERYAYITSVFTIWSFTDHEITLEKTFALDRYSYESRLMTEIIEKGYLSEDRVQEIVADQIFGFDISDDDIQASIHNLMDKGIIIKREDKYYLDMYRGDAK